MRYICTSIVAVVMAPAVTGADVLHVPDEYFNIAAAAFSASPGDTIEIASHYDSSLDDHMGVGIGVTNITIQGETNSSGSPLATLIGIPFWISSGCDPTFQDLSFNGGTGPWGTDSICGGYGSPNFTRCLFEDVPAVIAGSYTGTVSDCIFTNSSGSSGYNNLFEIANTTSSDMTMFTGCAFDSVAFPIWSEASAEGSIVVQGCAITECKPVVFKGGDVEVLDSTFSSCTIGAASIETSFIISNCNFEDNYGHQASAVSLQGDASGTFLNCTFADNLSHTRGAIQVETSMDIVLSNCVISDNTNLADPSGADAGGITTYMWNQPVSILLDDSTLCNNSPANMDCSVQISGTVTNTPACTNQCMGDTDGNGVVNIEDLLNMLGSWGACP